MYFLVSSTKRSVDFFLQMVSENKITPKSSAQLFCIFLYCLQGLINLIIKRVGSARCANLTGSLREAVIYVLAEFVR